MASFMVLAVESIGSWFEIASGWDMGVGLVERMSDDPASGCMPRSLKKKPAWSKTLRSSTTPAYSSTGHPNS